MSTLPVLALSVGDAAGIGPEIALRLLAAGPLPARLLVLGSRAALERDRALVAGGATPPDVDGPEDLVARDLAAGLLEPGAALEVVPRHGQVSAAAGAAAYAAFEHGVRLALAGRVQGLVTGPIHKEAWQRAGVPFPGHTEALAALAAVPRGLMLLVGGRLRAALATVHVPLATVPARLSRPGLAADLGLLHRDLGRLFGLPEPRIAVAGLNPHAGEAGLFGREDIDVIAPAVEEARAGGIDAVGPLPADACLPAAVAGGYDAVLAMFHDQALPVVKSVAWRRAVNVTLGLPFVRTSVDHGTAFDVAGRGVATSSSLDAAVRLAVEMAARAAAWKGAGSTTRSEAPN